MKLAAILTLIAALTACGTVPQPGNPHEGIGGSHGTVSGGRIGGRSATAGGMGHGLGGRGVGGAMGGMGHGKR